MLVLSLILLIFAFVLACCAARNWGAPDWVLGWAALAFFFLSLIVNTTGQLLQHSPR